jgi:hypothetical protein
MKNPHERLVGARIRVAQLKRQLAEAQVEESAAEHAAAEAERAERADTVRPPPPIPNTQMADAVDEAWS